MQAALALTDAEDRDAALYDLAVQLRETGRLDEALLVIGHIQDGYLPDRVALGSTIALDLATRGHTERAGATLLGLEALIESCEWAAVPGALLDLVNAHTNLQRLQDVGRLLERLDEVLRVPVRRGDSQLWVDTEKYKAQVAGAWARFGNLPRAEALAATIEIEHIRDRVTREMRDPGNNPAEE